MKTKNQGDFELTLEERLEGQRKKYQNYSEKAVTEAIKAFEKAYNAQNEKEKQA